MSNLIESLWRQKAPIRVIHNGGRFALFAEGYFRSLRRYAKGDAIMQYVTLSDLLTMLLLLTTLVGIVFEISTYATHNKKK